MSEHPVATVLVHPDADQRYPSATRIVRVATSHGDWPWRRLTGKPSEVPARGADLADWQVQPLDELAQVMGHPTREATA